MVTLEQVEKLRERTGISYEEARRILSETEGDLLEAVIKLEQQNRIKPPEASGYYHSKGEQKDKESCKSEPKQHYKGQENNQASFSELLGTFFQWVGRVLHKGNVNSFNVVKDDTKIMVIPLTVFALLLVFTFWVVLPVIIIGLIFGYRFYFSGPDLENTQVNRAMDTVSDATLRAVDSIQSAASKRSDNKDKGEKRNGENINN